MKNTLPQKVCFCTLALRKKYRLLTQNLAQDLEKYAPGKQLLIYTDSPQDFVNYPNVLAFQYSQKGILHCYHDKRFVMAEALSKFDAAIYIDADTRIISQIPHNINFQPGITVGHTENLVEHVSKYTPERLETLNKVASKLNLSLETVTYMGESLFVIAKDEGRETEFFKYWGIISNYLELKGIHAGAGNAMGLAATKVGWIIKKDGWQTIRKVTQHLDAASISTQQTFWDKWQRRIGYHYRLNKARIMALKDFNFYYN
ncbi:MAG: hypothetical protein QNJ47_01445 [Nostocaceae cyanobacterium]|nr:hypothetical protein [Nostocaceae cyanobacterium]